MIARLSGAVAEKHPNRIVVDVGGVGYDVFVPLSTFYVLGEQCRQSFVNRLQAARKRRVRGSGKRSAGYEPVTAAVGIDAAVAGSFGAGIDSEYAH